jgi:hypothetical protein
MIARFRISTFILLALAWLVSAPRIAHAAESYDNCTGFITSVPAVISTAGTWCLRQDVATAVASGSAIFIGADNVTLDCNNFRIDGQSAGLASQAFGVRAINRLGATVRNCNIRGFYVGVYFTGASGGGNIVENNRLAANTFVGAWIEGDGSLIRNNQILDTGGSQVKADAYGIYTTYAVDIADNAVTDVLARSGGNGGAVGIFTLSNSSGKITGNGVSDVIKDGSGHAVAIRNLSSGRIILRDNNLTSDGSAGSTGVSCSSANGAAKDNVLSSFTTAISVCTDSGGNSVIP